MKFWWTFQEYFLITTSIFHLHINNNEYYWILDKSLKQVFQRKKNKIYAENCLFKLCSRFTWSFVMYYYHETFRVFYSFSIYTKWFPSIVHYENHAMCYLYYIMLCIIVHYIHISQSHMINIPFQIEIYEILFIKYDEILVFMY